MISPTNVEIAERMLDAVNRGDVEAAIALMSPDVVFEPLPAPISGAYTGHAGIRQFFADTAETFETLRLEMAEVRDLGDGRVLGTGTMRARVRLGGLETEVSSAGIGRFREGRMTHWKDFGDPALARAGAGLERR